MTEARPKLLFHTQHLLGIGHRVRSHRIASAAAEAGFEVTLLEGGAPHETPFRQNITHIALPPVRTSDARFSGLVDLDGMPVGADWEEARRTAVLGALDTVNPDVVLIEGYPFARRRFAFELDPLVNTARDRGIATACSIRDVLVEKKDPKKNARIAEIAEASFDCILVHGDQAFIPLERSFPHADRLSGKTVYTGYVGAPVSGSPSAEPEGLGEVIVSAGGGAVGAGLFDRALAARANGLLREHPWRLLAGENLPAGARSRLLQKAETLNNGPGGAVILEPARPDFARLLCEAALSISQAGYNTIMDLAAARCPTVLIPFEGTGETEQPLRARKLAEHGLVRVIPEAALSPDRLARAAHQAVSDGRTAEWPLSRDGAAKTAAHLRVLSQNARAR